MLTLLPPDVADGEEDLTGFSVEAAHRRWHVAGSTRKWHHAGGTRRWHDAGGTRNDGRSNRSRACR